MGQLILWNDTKYIHTLAKFFSRENIVSNVEELTVALESWKKYSSIIVLCELDWSANGAASNMEHLQGIELVKDLRRIHNVTLPVLFVSFYSLPEIFIAEREILTAIRHNFYRLPGLPEDFIEKLKREAPLTPTELRDVQLFSCDPEGIVNSKLHQLSSSNLHQELKALGPAYIKEELEKFIEEIYSVFKLSADACITKFRHDFTPIHDGSLKKALRFIEDFTKDLVDKYCVSTDEEKPIGGIKKQWKLLLLDDELNKDYQIVKDLNGRGVEVVCTTNADDAMKVIAEDDNMRGKISVILTDYRLYDNSGEVCVQQKTQGYTFLQNVGNRAQSKLLSAVVYSGMPRHFLLETFKTYKLRPEIYSKIDFKLEDAGSRKFLVSRIIEIGDANYEALLALPLGSEGWADHLHNTYLLYRNQTDYERREREISDYCTDWVEKFRRGLNPATPMIKGDAFKPLLKNTNAQTLERFEAYFKTRRLAQYLKLYYSKYSSNDASHKIIKQLAPANKSIEKAASIRGYFSQVLCVKLEEFPFAATIEELCWFEYDLKIKVLEGYNRFRNKFDESEMLIGTFISGTKKLQDELRNTGYKHKDKKKHELLFNAQTNNPYLFDKMDFGLCLEWFDTQKEKFKKDETEEYLIMIHKLNEIWK